MKPGISRRAAGFVLGALAAFVALGGRISNAVAAVKASDAKALQALLGCPVITPKRANKYRIARDIANAPSPKAMVLWGPQHGALRDRRPTDTAFFHRESRYNGFILTRWSDPKDDARTSNGCAGCGRT